jgi:hypothetical protein
MTKAPTRRGPGAPSAAIPGMIGFAFFVIAGPAFCAFFLLAVRFMNGSDMSWINEGLIGSIIWIALVLATTLYPATRGKIWGIRMIRFLAIPTLLLYAATLAVDILVYIRLPTPQNGVAIFIFCVLVAPLAVAAWFYIQALRRQPWFNPNATLEEIGPSRGTEGDFNKQAGLDKAGRLSPELAAQALAAPPAPPRWLCYVLPPLAAARMRRWWFFAIATLLCLAAIVLLIVIPIRAIFVYGLMGSFADRLRVLQQIRLDAARGEKAAQDIAATKRFSNVTDPSSKRH